MNTLHVVAAILIRDSRILAAKRLPGGSAGNLWEFPGGKVEANETPQQAIVREIREELGIQVSVEKDFGTYITDIDQNRLSLHCFLCSTSETELCLTSHSQVVWLPAIELRQLDWASPDIPVVHRVIDLMDKMAQR